MSKASCKSSICILLISPSEAMHSRRFLQMLLDSGHSVIYMDQHNSRFYREGNCIYIPYPSELIWLEQIRPTSVRKALIRWLMAVRFWFIWQRYNPDIVHIHLIGNSAYYCLSAHIHPVILTAWGSDINDFFPIENQDPIRLRKIAYILNSAGHITTDSQEVSTRCEILAGRQLNTSLFYYGIDLDIFKPLPEIEIQEMRRNMGISSNTKVLLSVRRLIPKMCHDLVLKAFSQVLSRTNLDVVLVFREVLDRDNEYVFRLKQLAHELGVGNRVVWQEESEYSQMPLIYNIADVVINFPNQDGLPVSLFEAAACMKPVITSELEAYQEFLANSGFFMVPAESVSMLADTIESVLLDSGQEIKEKLKINYELVLQRAEQNKCFREMQKIYDAVLAQEGGKVRADNA